MRTELRKGAYRIKLLTYTHKLHTLSIVINVCIESTTNFQAVEFQWMKTTTMVMIHRQVHLPIPCYDFYFLAISDLESLSKPRWQP